MARPPKRLRKKTIKAPNGQKTTVQMTPWFSPYVKKGARWLTTMGQFTDAQCGVYFIRSKQTKELLYVGHSGSQLKKTLYRHFQSWVDDQYRATYASRTAYEVMIITTDGCPIAFQIEQYFLHKQNPRDGVQKLVVPKEEIDFTYMPKLEEQPQYLEEVPF